MVGDYLIWAVELVEQFAVLYFIFCFLKNDLKPVSRKIIYAAGSIAGFIAAELLNFSNPTEWWQVALYIVYFIVFSAVFIKGNIFYKLLAVFIASAVLINARDLIFVIFDIWDVNGGYLRSDTAEFLRALGFLIVEIIILGAILKLTSKSILQIKKGEWLLIISVFLMSAFSLGMIHLVTQSIVIDETDALMLTLSEIGFFVLNMLCVFIILSLNKSNRIAEEYKLKEQQLKHNIQYAESVRSQYREIRKMRHDMKQHLATVSALQMEGKFDAAQEYISNISNDLERIEMLIDVGNDFVNAILNSKLSIAKSKGIEVICSSSSQLSGINEYDLCNLIGNMLDNAIEAAEKVAENSVIEVSIISDKHKVMIKVSNSIAKSVLSVNSALRTTKEESTLHGFGITSIRSIAEKYNGSADFYEENLTFICRVILGKDAV